MVTTPTSTSLVFVVVTAGAVTVTRAELETPLNIVTGGGVLVAMVGAVIVAINISVWYGMGSIYLAHR